MNKQSSKRRRRLAVVVTATLAAVGIGVGVVGTGTADAAGACVSRTEYRNLTKGMTPSQVYNRTGARGKITSAYDGYYYDSQSREYRACNSGEWGFVSITFDNDHNVGGNRLGLGSKYAYWG